jgi:hypothetical protein
MGEDDEQEYSAGGSRMLRYGTQEASQDPGWRPPAEGVEGTMEAICATMEAHFGTVDLVWHELISELVHLDIHQIRATEERPFHVLFTTGMSDLPMTLPEGASTRTQGSNHSPV